MMQEKEAQLGQGPTKFNQREIKSHCTKDFNLVDGGGGHFHETQGQVINPTGVPYKEHHLWASHHEPHAQLQPSVYLGGARNCPSHSQGS